MAKIKKFFMMKVTSIVFGVVAISATALIAAGYVVEVDGTNDDLYIDDSGNVGIGTTSPYTKLHVNNDSGTSTVRIQRSSYLYDAGIRLYTGTAQDWFIGTGTINDNTRDLDIYDGVEGQSRLYITESGNIGIGTTNPTSKLHVYGTINSASTITAANYSCSDARYKHSITPIGNAMQKLMSLNGVFYSWKTEKFKDMNFSKDRQLGFIAQEVEKVVPELVYTDSKGYKSMSYNKLTAVIVEAMKEMKKVSDRKIASLEKKNQFLEKENLSLKKRIASLEKMDERVAALERMLEVKRVALK
jgi:hypothetical protein